MSGAGAVKGEGKRRPGGRESVNVRLKPQPKADARDGTVPSAAPAADRLTQVNPGQASIH